MVKGVVWVTQTGSAFSPPAALKSTAVVDLEKGTSAASTAYQSGNSVAPARGQVAALDHGVEMQRYTSLEAKRDRHKHVCIKTLTERIIICME